jgi:RNA polymerase sigma-70 factor (ECF subfamily)
VDYSTLDDPALIRLIAHARTEALSALYDRYGRLVFSLALHALGDQALAEEITQDVFFRIWEKAGTYRPEEAKVSTWLTSITRHRAIDVLRQRGVRPALDHTEWSETQLMLVPDGADSPEEVTERALQQELVRRAVALLPVEQSRMLEMAYFQGLTHSQIATISGEPLGTVKTRIRLAMQKLREILVDDDLGMNRLDTR